MSQNDLVSSHSGAPLRPPEGPAAEVMTVRVTVAAVEQVTKATEPVVVVGIVTEAVVEAAMEALVVAALATEIQG